MRKMNTSFSLMIIAALIVSTAQCFGQGIIGTWQLTEEKTCFESGIKESQTEKELKPDMQPSQTGVAHIIRFDKKGKGEDGIFSAGNKKGAGMNSFKYKAEGQDILLLDVKSGILTQHLIIEELSAVTLRVHNAKKDCEIKTFTRIK